MLKSKVGNPIQFEQFDRTCSFSMIYYKQNLLVLSLTLLAALTLLPSVSADSEVCQREELGPWTKNLPFSLGTNISINIKTKEWTYSVIELRQGNDWKCKIVIQRKNKDIKIDGISIDMSFAEMPLNPALPQNDMIFTFKKEKGEQFLVIQDNSGQEHRSKVGQVNISKFDNVRIFSQGSLDSVSKTVINVCNSGDDWSDNSEHRATSCPDPPPCPCPTPNPCQVPEPVTCPSSTPAEKPSCPNIACPSIKPIVFPTESLVPKTTQSPYDGDDDTSYLISDRINTTGPEELASCKAIFIESWDIWIMYALVAACAVLLIISTAMAIALCAKGQRQPKSEVQKTHVREHFTDKSSTADLYKTMRSQGSAAPSNYYATSNYNSTVNGRNHQEAQNYAAEIFAPRDNDSYPSSSEWDQENIYENLRPSNAKPVLPPYV